METSKGKKKHRPSILGGDTDLFQVTAAQPTLQPVPKDVFKPKPKSATQQRAEASAAARWGTRNVNSSRPAGSRAWRRKENITESGTHRQYDLDELIKWYVTFTCACLAASNKVQSRG